MTRAVIDAKHLFRQRDFSRQTFGPGRRTQGVLKHIRKELREIEEAPTSLEWVDVIILAFDGALRAGWEPQQILDAVKAKQAKNEARQWPDWRTMRQDQAIEHVRDDDECSCTVYVVDHSDPEPHHPENLDREDDPACPVHGVRDGESRG